MVKYLTINRELVATFLRTSANKSKADSSHPGFIALTVLLLLTGIIAEPQTEHKLVIVAGFRLCTTGLPGDIRPRFAPCSALKSFNMVSCSLWVIILKSLQRRLIKETELALSLNSASSEM